MPARGQGQTFHQQPAINLESPYQPTGVPELDETMGTERRPWPSSVFVLIPRMNEELIHQDSSVCREPEQSCTEPWRPQQWDSSRDPQWDQRRHGCQERSHFEGPRPVARQIYDIINLMWSLEQSSKDLGSPAMYLYLSFSPLSERGGRNGENQT